MKNNVFSKLYLIFLLFFIYPNYAECQSVDTGFESGKIIFKIKNNYKKNTQNWKEINVDVSYHS